MFFLTDGHVVQPLRFYKLAKLEFSVITQTNLSKTLKFSAGDRMHPITLIGKEYNSVSHGNVCQKIRSVRSPVEINIKATKRLVPIVLLHVRSFPTTEGRKITETGGIVIVSIP